MAFNLANMFVIFINVHFSYHILMILFNRKHRRGMQQTNTRLEELRCKPKKTLEEQKEFITLKKPKRIGKFKWRWSSLPKIILTIGIYVVLFRAYFFVFDYFNINLVLWQAITYMIFFPLILNLVLERFKVQKGDISVFFRGGKKK